MNEFQRRLLDIAEMNDAVMLFADPHREVLLIDNYAYIVDTQGQANITFTNTITTKLIMDSDCDFVLTYISGGAIIPATTDNPERVNQLPAIDVQITDLASGRTFFNIPTALPLIAGFNGFPFILTSPRVIKARSTLQVTMQACAAAGVFSAGYMALHGARIYYA